MFVEGFDRCDQKSGPFNTVATSLPTHGMWQFRNMPARKSPRHINKHRSFDEKNS
jgi:hypothetical protein